MSEIKPNQLFADSGGCLLKTIRQAEGSSDWWCVGQPDCIGEWRYSESTIKAGVERCNRPPAEFKKEVDDE